MDDVPNPVPTPTRLLVWDGDCGFCKRSVLWLERRCGERLETSPWQTALAVDPSLPLTEQQCRTAVRLVEPAAKAGAESERVVRSGAAAIFRALALAPGHGLWWFLYRFLPGFALLTEFAYARVARNRVTTSRVLRSLAGSRAEPPTWLRARRLFALLIGIALAAACVSAAGQIPGLLGPDGVWPADQELRSRPDLTWTPTLAWLGTSNAWLVGLSAVGALAGVLTALGFAARYSLLAGWLAYLSIVSVGGQFFGAYEADNLLLEAVLLGGLFVLPGGSSRAAWEREPSAVGVFLLRLLLFRVVFFAGLYKLQYGGIAWESRDALQAWLLTQPFPHGGSAWASQLGMPVLRWLAFGALAIELVAPWAVLLGPRRLRAIGGAAIVLVQVGTVVFGNVGFLPLVVVALAMFAFDDTALRRAAPVAPVFPSAVWVRVRLAAAVLLTALATLGNLSVVSPTAANTLFGVRQWFASVRLGNTYAFGVVIPLARFRLLLEWRDERGSYHELSVPSLPGPDGLPSPFLGLHVPRLALLLWSQALDAGTTVDAGRDPRLGVRQWFAMPEARERSLLRRLLQEKPEVWALFGPDDRPTGLPSSARRMRVRVVQQDWRQDRSEGSLVESQVEDVLPPLRIDQSGKLR